MQVSNSSTGGIQVGNATILSADLGAVNGVVHIVNTFPLLNAAFNTSMIAALEAAGDFGPFSESKVRKACCAAAVLLAMPWWGPEGGGRDRPGGGGGVRGVMLW